MFTGKDKISLVPRPCVFVACIQYEIRTEGPGLVHHVMCATADVTTILLRINDVTVTVHAQT